jgi:hypothetical protein
MYKIIEELQQINEILVVDLTSGLGIKSYHDDNIKHLILDDKTDLKLSYNQDIWRPLSEINSDITSGYQNVEVRNPAWPSEMMIFQDYGNHEGSQPDLSFDERVLFPCLSLGSESVGYYDKAISVFYRTEKKLFVFKICKSPVKPNIEQIRQKRPTNISYSLTSEDPDAKVIVNVLFQYNDVENPEWKEIMIPAMTAWDIHKPSWIEWIMKTL